MLQLQLFFCSIVTNGTRCSSAETHVCHRSYIIAAMWCRVVQVVQGGADPQNWIKPQTLTRWFLVYVVGWPYP